ncbi:hypothetical protein YLM1_1729 [Methanobrevibacter olleyae]|uniref:Uncharacterized protein n=1 Tax=Methanobrevibacter olleyae TaxID=294671 RepID=A0A126R2L4_METOL|nr:hypothetical protein YLM1_1729 [Methanobrevibacter olleyae]
MKYFKAFINIPNPKPPNKPVRNLNQLLLNLHPYNCVNPSTNAGIIILVSYDKKGLKYSYHKHLKKTYFYLIIIILC